MAKSIPLSGESPNTRASPVKKTYEKPSVIFERALEALAAVCDPNASPKGKVLRGVDGCQIAFS